MNKEISKRATAKSVVLHHLGAFQDNNINAVMDDYTHESVLITGDATYKGIKEIKDFLGGLMQYFPKPASTIELNKLEENGDLVYINWHAKTPTLQVPFATDTFIIKAHKIHRQTFGGELKFI